MVYIPFALWLLYVLYIAGNHDSLGLFSDLILQFITKAGGFVAFICARYIWPKEWMTDTAPFMYLHALQTPLYCCMFVLYPAVSHSINRHKVTRGVHQIQVQPAGLNEQTVGIEHVLNNNLGQ
jgi:hypothetical protein